MADTQDLGSCAARREGSSPSFRTSERELHQYRADGLAKLVSNLGELALNLEAVALEQAN